MGEWFNKRMDEIAEFNPRESIPKGTIAKKIAMEKLQPFCRDVPGYELEAFAGGSKFRNGDTIMARITPCLENGKTAKVDILEEDEVGFGSTEFIVFRAKDGNDPDFIYYLVTSPIIREPSIKSMVGSSGRQRVQTDVVQSIIVRVPGLKEQQEIAGILKSLDDKIVANRRINENLAEQIQTLCNAWLNDYIPFDGICPADWKLTPLSSFARFISGYSYKGNELQPSSIAMATIKNFDRKGGFKLDGYKEVVPSGKLKPEHHASLFDTLVAHTDLTQNAEVIGNAEPILSFSRYEDIIFSMDVVKVVPNNPAVSKFLIAAMLQTQQFKGHCLGYVNGTTVLHLSKKALPEYSLMLPRDFSVLSPLDEAVSSMYQQMALNIDECVQLTKLRDTLLPLLMSGVLDVSDLDL